MYYNKQFRQNHLTRALVNLVYQKIFFFQNIISEFMKTGSLHERGKSESIEMAMGKSRGEKNGQKVDNRSAGMALDKIQKDENKAASKMGGLNQKNVWSEMDENYYKQSR